MSEHYHEEAQTVAWSDVMVNGWKISVTARQGATSADIVTNVLALGEALKTLREKYGAAPYLNGNGPKAANAALASATPTPGPQASPDDAAWNAMQSATQDPAVQAALAKAKANGYPPAFSQPQQPQPQQPQAPTLAGGVPDPAWCPIHGCAMKRHEKDSQVWYSHKAPDGTWCRGKRKDPPSLGSSLGY